MIDVRFRPLEKWNGAALERRRSPFAMTYARTLDLLEAELRYLGAKDIVIESGFLLEQIRNDGWPRGGEQPKHPGVILYFRGLDGPMRFPCGTFAGYQANIHAIAMTLENLRRIDRYGVTVAHEQYLGFKALPAGSSETWTVDTAAAWLEANCGGAFTADPILSSPDCYRSAYKNAAARLHPDNQVTGNTTLFQALQTVAGLLDAHHGLKSKAGAK